MKQERELTLAKFNENEQLWHKKFEKANKDRDGLL